MRILVTNDDGINAPGLRALTEAMMQIGDVLVVSPEREQSCAGHAITLHKPLRMYSVKLAGLDVEARAVSGTPADCVVLARSEEPVAPDLVVAGINAGANLGEEVFYSGTVAAAMEGCLQGLRSMAVSVTAYHDCDFRAAAQFAARIAPEYAALDLPKGILLNINSPNMAPEAIKGVRVTRLGRRAYINAVHKRHDPRGRSYYWVGGEATEADSADGTDIAACRDGYISVTPLRFDTTCYEATALVEGLVGSGDAR